MNAREQGKIIELLIGGLLLLISTIPRSAIAQEQQGVVHSNYAGITSYGYNPADLLNQQVNMDFNLLSGNFFVFNNFLYLDRENFDFSQIFKKNPQFKRHGNYLTYSFDEPISKNAFVDMSLTGPSLLLNLGENAIAIHTAARGAFSLDDLPHSVTQFSYKGSTYDPLHDSIFNEPNFLASGAVWNEIGVSYSHQFEMGQNEVFTAGIGVNYLMGIAGGHFFSESLKYIVPSKDSLAVEFLNGEMAYSLPVNYDNNEPELMTNNKLTRGTGYSFNLGFTYQKISLGRQYSSSNRFCELYEYKVGISFTDIGAINFTDKSRKYTFINSQTQWDGYYEYSYSGLNHLDSVINAIFEPTPADTSNPTFTSVLPSAFRAYFDYRFQDNWMLNANMILGLNQSRKGIRRPSQFAVVPRWETPNIEFAFPITLYDLSEIYYGFSVRIWYITLGTDDISTIFGDNQFNKGGFYFSFKYRLKGNCRSRNKGIFDAF